MHLSLILGLSDKIYKMDFNFLIFSKGLKITREFNGYESRFSKGTK